MKVYLDENLSAEIARLLRGMGVDAVSAHAGIIIVLASFRGDEFQLIADRIHDVARHHPGGLRGSVVFLQREAIA